jgi:flagellar basal body rod protein FlgB
MSEFLNVTPVQFNGNHPPETDALLEEMRALRTLLQEQQSLNASYDQLRDDFATQQHQLQALNLLYQQLAPDIAQHSPPDYSPIQQQYEALLQKIEATDDRINQTLKQHQSTDQSIHKTLQLIERKESSMESAIRGQEEVIAAHFSPKMTLLQMGAVGLGAACVGLLMVWIMPGGIQQLQANQKQMESTLFLVWRDQQATHKRLGIPTPK